MKPETEGETDRLLKGGGQGQGEKRRGRGAACGSKRRGLVVGEVGGQERTE